MERKTEEWSDPVRKRREDGQRDGRMEEWREGWISGVRKRWNVRRTGRIMVDGRVAELMNLRQDEETDGRSEEGTDGWSGGRRS